MPRTTPGSGALLKPSFDSFYGVSSIEVLSGGTGYAKTDPPKIVIEGTSSPTTEGVFFPVISGVGTISQIIIFKSGLGYYPVFSTSSSSEIAVERGTFGTQNAGHAAGIAYSVFAGDYNIVDDNIFFTDAPYGKSGPVGLQTGSSFSGRLFSRKLDPFDEKDQNVILDDISLDFTGVAGTQFTLSENTGVVTALYNSVNTGVDINNNPFILINNIVQTPGLDFEIVDSTTNKINFLSGVPRAGRISKVGLQTGSGYYLPTKAAARVGVGTTGSLEFIQIEGKGLGYRTLPEISVRSSQGYGASITAFLGTSSGSAVAISTATYNHIAGVATFNTGAVSHGFEIDDRVRITGAGFTFTPVSVARNINTFGFNYISGIATIGVTGGHYIGTSTNQSRSLLLQGIQVSDGITTYTLREDAYPITEVIDNLNVLVNLGISTQPLSYEGGGTVRAGVDTAIMEGRNVVGFDIIGITTNTFETFVGISSFAHLYVSGGVINRAEAGIVTNFSIVEGGTGFYRPRTISFLDQTPVNGITTITAFGDQDGSSINISGVDYESFSGIATITSASAHGLTTSSVVKLAGIAFSTGFGDITFPSDAQKYFGVTGVISATNFTVSIGAAMTTTGIHTAQAGVGSFIPFEGHGLETDDYIQATGIAVTFTSAPAVQVGDVEYDERSGIATVTTRRNHNLTEDDCVVLSGIAFTCDYDPALGVSSALYDNTTGVLTVTTAAPHGYKVGKDVVMSGLAFTCSLDNGAYQHYYPRSRSTAYDTSLPITGYAGTGLSIDVGISRVKNQYVHRFEEAITGALVYGGDYPHQFLRAEEGVLLTGGPYLHGFYSATATSTFAGGDYAHTYVSSDEKTIKVGGDYAHTFDSSDADSISVVGGGTTTPTGADYTPSTGSLILTVANHGLTGPTQHSITTANYNPIVGILTVTVPSHGFGNGDLVRIADNSIGWKCSLDAFTSTKYYPRSTDPLSNNWVPISNKTTDTFEVFAGITTRLDYTVSGADYTPSVGVMTMSIGTHDLTAGQSIKFKDSSLGFTCTADQNTVVKYYPRSKDPTYNTAVPITGVAGTTITVNVGISTIVKYNIRFASYTPASGIMTVSLDRLHGFQAGESIKFKNGSVAFKCEQDGFQSNHFYPRPTDPYYDKPVTLVSAAGTEFVVNVGATGGANMYQFLPNQGVAVEGVIAGGDYPYTLSGVGTDAVITGGGDYTPYWYQSSVVNAVERPSQQVQIAEGSLNFKCAKDNYATVHAYPRNTDPAYNTNLGIVSATTNTFEVRVGPSTIQERSISTSTYNPATGEFTMTVGAGHSYINESAHTISTATYNASTGVLEPTISNHGFVAGEYVKFDLESITFKCDKDGYTADKAYPRYSDPYLNKWLPIYNVGVNTFSVFVGISTVVNTHWFQSATTGGLKKARDTVGINTASINFTCARDNHATIHAYPRPDDPIGGNVSVGIGSTSATTLTINVGVSTIVNYGITTAAYTASTGIMTVFSNVHGFNGAISDKIIDFATYDAGSGIMTCTVPTHGLVTGNRVQFKRDSIRFRCMMDQRKTIKSYPRRKDPSDQQWLSITTVDLDKFSVNVGTSPLVYHSPTAGSFDPFTGLMTITIGSHTLKKGTSVKLKTRGFKFTCALDNHATNHFYPRASGISGPDPAYNTAVKITATTDTTITLDVGKSSNQTEHIFVSATVNSVISGGNYLHTFENAETDALLIARDTLGLATDSYTWRCSQDNYATDHTYPRSTDPIHNIEVGVVTSTTDTFTINVGITSRVKFNVTNATYDANSGLVTMTTDTSHGLSTTTSIGIATNGLVYSCSMDQYSSEHAYPRTTDPAHDTALYPTAVTSNNVTVNVGVSTRVEYNINHADYNEMIGIMTAYLPVTHGITTAAGVGRNVKLKNESIYFSCSQDNYATKQLYPKGGDPYYNGSIITRVISNTQIETQVGPSTTPSFYNSGGKIQGVILAPRLNNNSASGTDYAAGGAFVDKIIDSKTYVVNVGISTVDHNYARGGLSQQGKRIASSIEKGFSGFDVIEKVDNARFRVDAGLTTQFSLYKRGGEVTKPVIIDVTEPDPYFNRDLEYVSGSTGIGTNSKVDFRINVDGNISEFSVLEEGTAYKVGDRLTVSGIATDPRVGVNTEFQLIVEELESDTFSGFYPGQFILFDDIAPFFNGSRKKFTLSVTTAGNTEILSLKTLPGSDMDITNNIFIYINDILQTPQSSYIFKGSRVIFTEAPKENSKCSVFYFRGSKRDVETVEPSTTLKPGDQVEIKENRFTIDDVDQFERTAKRIIASDILETFTYNSVGIDTSQDADRPLTLEKQRHDQILSGVLISKARPSLKSRVLPTTRIIKNVSKTDESIYVSNAFPIFSAIDKLIQSERNIQIFDDTEVLPGILTSVVSTSSSISSLSIGFGGTGYTNFTAPKVAISSSLIKREDPISAWEFDAITGITSAIEFKALTKEEPIIAVGSSSYYMNTKSGSFWERGRIGFGGTVTFNGVGVGYSATSSVFAMAVGDYGSMARAVSVGNSMSTWTAIGLFEKRQIPAINQTLTLPSTYAGNFQDVVWEGTRNTWVAVGAAGSIFTAVGITTAAAFSQFSGTLQTLNSVCYGQSEFIAVGNGGVIIASNDGTGWGDKVSNTNFDLNDVIYDGNRFIVVGDSGTIGISTDKNFWQPWSQQLPAGTVHPATFDFKTIKFIDNIYIGISTVGDLYYSFDLANWNKRDVDHSNEIRDIVDTPFGDFASRRIIAVGSGTTTFYADPVINRATATASVTAGVITSVTVTDGGFGYEVGSSPPVIVETDKTVKEDVLSVDAEGDFGDIVGINTWLPGTADRLPQLTFTLKSQFNDNTNLGYGYSSLNSLGVNFSGLDKGDYFTIYDSSLVVGHALTGITTSSGSNVSVGMVTSGDYLGGVFRVEQATAGDATSGLTTVTCAFLPGPVTYGNNTIQVGLAVTSDTDTFWGKYSWGKFYGYQNRASGNPQEFFVNSNNGLTGISTAPVVSRKKPLT